MSKDTPQPAEEVNKAEGKYSWERIDEYEWHVWHKEGNVNTFIASTDTSEKAHLLAAGANSVSSSPPDAGKEQEAVAKYVAVSPNNTDLIEGWYSDASGNAFQLIQYNVYKQQNK